MRAVVLLLAALGLSACASAVPPVLPTSEGAPAVAGQPSPEAAADNFIAVVDQVEPVAERICRAETADISCDYQIVVDSRTDQPRITGSVIPSDLNAAIRSRHASQRPQGLPSGSGS